MTETVHTTLQVYDGVRGEFVAAGPATASVAPSEWFRIEDSGGDRSLRTYGVVHLLTEGSHTVTVSGWEPDSEVSDEMLDEMHSQLAEFYREAPPAVSNNPADERGAGRVYYFTPDSDEAVHAHRSTATPNRHDGVTLNGRAYFVLGTSVGMDEEGTYVMVNLSSDCEDAEDCPSLIDAKRTLEGQRRKARTDWN